MGKWRVEGARWRPVSAIVLAVLALALAVIIVDLFIIVPNRRMDIKEANEIEAFPPIAANVPQAAVAIDPEAVLELQQLLQAFVPVAQAHDISFDAGLLEELERQSARLGISAPVSVTFEGDAGGDYGLGIAAVYLPDDAAALASELSGAAEAWVATLASAPTIIRVQAGAGSDSNEPGTLLGNPRTAFAPASRSGARAGQPVNTTAVRQLTNDFDAWLANEAQAAYEAELNRIANLRARMVALSRAAGNGRLPAEALCPIPFSPRFTMRCDVIDSLVELNAAFRAHFGRDLVVVSGYRANPGTSNHGWGLAVDFGGQMSNFGTAEFNWMNANARQFGWGHAFWAVPGGINPQPWHWEAMDQIREMTGSWR